MRIIPVIDLRQGQAVHAHRGERNTYQPVKSVLCGSANPMELARAFRDRLGITELYIADLDSIQGEHTGHRDLITTLSNDEGLNVMLDAGIPDSASARDWLSQGVRKSVIGAETVNCLQSLHDIPATIDPERLVFSLDMHGGRILSRSPELAECAPLQVLEILNSAGWREVIMLDISRVGSQTGTDIALLSKARDRFPRLRLLTGGGISSLDQLWELQNLKISGVLIATALHHGKLTAEDIAALRQAADCNE